MTTFQKRLFFTWLICILIFFLSLASMVIAPNQQITDTATGILVVAFITGVIAFLLLFASETFRLINIPLTALSTKIQMTARKLFSKISKKMVIIVSVILTIFLLIYWFQLRPAQIKSSCQKEADEWYEKAFDINKGKNGLISFEDLKDIQQGTKNKYSFCLHRNGL